MNNGKYIVTYIVISLIILLNSCKLHTAENTNNDKVVNQVANATEKYTETITEKQVEEVETPNDKTIEPVKLVEAVNDEPVEQVKPVDAPPKYPEDIGCYDDDEKIIFMRASGETYTVKKEKSTVVYKDDTIEITGRQVYVDSSKTVYMNDDGSFITVLNENRPVENKSNSNNSSNNSNNSNNTNTSNNSGNSNNGNGTSSGNVEIPEEVLKVLENIYEPVPQGTGSDGNGGESLAKFSND